MIGEFTFVIDLDWMVDAGWISSEMLFLVNKVLF